MIAKIKAIVRQTPSFFSRRLHCIYALALVTSILFSVLALSVNHVSITAGKKEIKVNTLLSNTDRILESANIFYGENDKVVVTPLSHNKLNIAVKYAFPVYVTIGNTTTTVMTTGDTVGEIIKLANFIVSEYDIINYDLDAFISDTAYIDVVDIDYITETYVERIYYQSKTTYSSAYAKGTKIIKDGSEGSRQVTCKKTIVNGVTSATEILNSVVLTPAVDQEIILGTKKVEGNSAINSNIGGKKPQIKTSENVKCISNIKPPKPIQLDNAGNPIHYSKHITVTATAYTGGRKGASGLPATTGYIAVNPNYIPYGTKMYIRSSDGKYNYGYAIAGDTGAFVMTNPTNVDLTFSTYAECCKFGRRNVEIYILN